MRIIDADSLRDYMWHICGETDEEIDKGRAKWESGLWIRYKVFEDALENAPTIDAEPVRHGHWEVVDETEPRRWGCSNCRCLSWHEFYYCPNCGAKMDEEENENETD